MLERFTLRGATGFSIDDTGFFFRAVNRLLNPNF